MCAYVCFDAPGWQTNERYNGELASLSAPGQPFGLQCYTNNYGICEDEAACTSGGTCSDWTYESWDSYLFDYSDFASDYGYGFYYGYDDSDWAGYDSWGDGGWYGWDEWTGEDMSLSGSGSGWGSGSGLSSPVDYSCDWVENNINTDGEKYAGDVTSKSACIALVRSECPRATIANVDANVEVYGTGACWCQFGSDMSHVPGSGDEDDDAAIPGTAGSVGYRSYSSQFHVHLIGATSLQRLSKS